MCGLWRSHGKFFPPPATPRRLDPSPSWPPPWWKPVRKWTNSSSRNSKAPETARSCWTARLPSLGSGRLFNLASSGTRKEEDLLDPKVLEKTSFLRRAMSPMKVIDATETLLERMSKTKNNHEFLDLIQTA